MSGAAEYQDFLIGIHNANVVSTGSITIGKTIEEVNQAGFQIIFGADNQQAIIAFEFLQDLRAVPHVLR